MRVFKKILKIGGILFLAVVLLSAVGFAYVLFGSNTKSTEDISYYRALSGETDGSDMMPVFSEEFDMPCPYDLPALRALEPYLDYRFNYTAKRESVFQSHAYILILSYDAEEYEARKRTLETQYSYLEEIDEGISGLYNMSGFTIRAVEGGDYPNEMLFVAVSDTRQEIGYIYYYDQDLDYIDDPLGKFLAENTGWNDIAE